MTKAKAIPSPEVDWEIKDRTYILTNNRNPLTWTIQTRHTRKKPLLYFDENTGINRELRYATNQSSVFVDEQDGYATLGHVYFSDGALTVPRNNQNLQKLLSLYHPQAGATWVELNPQKEALDEVETIEVKLEAMNLVSNLDIDDLEAIMRAEIGSEVNKLSTKELKRDAYNLATNHPQLFIDLANDEDIKFRNLANRAVEMGVVKLTDDNTVFKWASNDKKIMTVPFDQHPYAAFAQYFKTDEGVAVMKSIVKKLS